MANPTFIDSQHISRLNPEETLTTNGLGAAIRRNRIFHHEGREEHEEKKGKLSATTISSCNSGKTHQNAYPLYLCVFAPLRAIKSFARICANLRFISLDCGQRLLKNATYAETG